MGIHSDSAGLEINQRAAVAVATAWKFAFLAADWREVLICPVIFPFGKDPFLHQKTNLSGSQAN